MRKRLDLTGQRFGRGLVVKQCGSDRHGKMLWELLCDCGNHYITRGSDLKRGRSLSCGCFRKEFQHNEKTTHGESDNRIYRILSYMKTRCYNTNILGYKYYGGKGIKVCDEWKNDFLKFKEWALSNGYQDDLSIDRIDSNGDYCPENCRWITLLENSMRGVYSSHGKEYKPTNSDTDV